MIGSKAKLIQHLTLQLKAFKQTLEITTVWMGDLDVSRMFYKRENLLPGNGPVNHSSQWLTKSHQVLSRDI